MTETTTSAESPTHVGIQPHSVDIEVNGKRVVMPQSKTTGLDIKETAIDQGVEIGVDFQLSEDLGNRKKKIIGDNDTVSVHEGEKFIAVAGDDNS